MTRNSLLAAGCAAAVAVAAWLAAAAPSPAWETAFDADGLTVFRSVGSPAGYGLHTEKTAILIDPPEPGVPGVRAVWLTHHHRDTVEHAGAYVAAKIPVRAPAAAAEWLDPAAVTTFWADAVPLRNSRTAYFVHPTGIPEIAYDLKDGTTLDLGGGWTLAAVATPGHSRDHLSFVASRPGRKPLVFAGDAVTGSGKLWTPFTTDWDHWTDAGLTPTAESLRKLAKLDPEIVFPARGPVMKTAPAKVLTAAATAVEEVAFLRSFERYTNRLGNVPEYDFLVPKEQIASGGDKPWSKVSEHVWLTGNTYVVTSKDGPCLVLDPWGQRSVTQIAKLRADQKIGPVEVVVFSHAHYDHYDGVYELPGRDGYKIWALDQVAGPLKEPMRLRAPFLDGRPIAFDRELKDHETATWREYTFRFRHLPGQTLFTAGMEAVIDGKKCMFTADNFFHQKQFSGSGGWMGLNRSLPGGYAASAKTVTAAAPDWVLAEHGGPFVFHAEDFRRRETWANASAAAADAVCDSGKHADDWNPHRVTVEPLLQKAKPGGTVSWTITAGPADVRIDGRDVCQITHPPGGKPRGVLAPGLKPGRYVFSVRPTPPAAESADAFVVVDVE